MNTLNFWHTGTGTGLIARARPFVLLKVDNIVPCKTTSGLPQS